MEALNEDYRLAAIMFTDIYSFSKMMEKNEKKMLELLRGHNDIISGLVLQYNGHVIKTIGDAFMVEFKSSVNAVECAVAIQNALLDFNKDKPKDRKLYLRIGIHLGDIWFFENDAFGEGVNIASRLQSLSKPGRICISGDVYNQVFNKLEVEIFSLGKAKLKNITKEIQAYEITTGAAGEFDLHEPAFEEWKGEEKSYIEEKPSGKAASAARKKTVSRAAKNAPAAGTGAVRKGARMDGSKPEAAVMESGKMDGDRMEQSLIGRLQSAGTRVPITQIKKFLPVPAGLVEGMLNKLTEKGYLTAVEGPNGLEYSFGDFHRTTEHAGGHRFLDEMAERHGGKGKKHGGEFSFTEEKAKRIKKTGKYVNSFFFNLAFFVIGNCFLYFINLWLSPSFLWLWYITIGWGAGLAGKLAVALAALRQRGRLLKLTADISKEQYFLVRKYCRDEMRFFGRLHRCLSFSGLFLTANLLVSPSVVKIIQTSAGLGFIASAKWFQAFVSSGLYKLMAAPYSLWFFYPAAVLAVLAAIDFVRFQVEKSKIREELRFMGNGGAEPGA